MSVAAGFKVELVASEPMIAQPVCIEFDDRGRLWVIQYLQYPNPAGLQRAKVDRFSRTTYDKIPEPPPRGPKGADRITILVPVADDVRRRSDISDNQSASSRQRLQAKDFVSGLNLASGLAFGHGGVFVLQVPYLLFYPDKNRDDIPDSDPEVLLTGFGMEDAHSVANSLTWGPDGWLYGCQGSTVTANIRGIEFQQGVWRYHPISKRFELFCEGGGNSWGLDFDEDGNLIYSTNLGPYRNLHAVQGGYYWKSFGKHGALHNPYAYGFFDHIPYKNFTGGHVTDGGIIYQGDSFPEKFRGQYIANDLLGHTVQIHNMEKSRSTFTASYGGELLNPNDTWFAPTDLTMGPDGALYVADWHDKRTAHPDPDAEWDRSNGRIYKIEFAGSARGPRASVGGAPTDLDLVELSSTKLLELLSHKNDWFVRKARRILADRHDVTTYAKLRAQIFEAKDEHLALESFWALYASGGADESFLNDALEHSSPKIRRWAVRFLGDEEKISPTSSEDLLKISASESDVMVRSQLASTARRLPANFGLALAQKIALRNLDESDPHIPLLLWWAVENHCVGAVAETLDLFASEQTWKSALIRETILPRLMRRYAAEGAEKTLVACARLLETLPAKEREKMLESLEQGFREEAKQIPKLEMLPVNLQKQLTSFWKEDTRDATLIRLFTRLGLKSAGQRALDLAKDNSSPIALRVTMLQLLGESATPQTASALSELSAVQQPEAIQLAALEAMPQIPNAPIESVLKNYPQMSARVRSKARDVLFSRKDWAGSFLKGVAAKTFPPDEVPLEQLQKIALLNDKELNDLVRKIWGNIGSGTPEEKLADIRRFNNDLRAFPGDAKNGREVFLKSCAACHEFFGEGEKVGPELTHANRADKDFLLTSIVDPNAVIRKEFLNYNIETSDGRVLNGLIAEQNANGVTLVGAKNERTTISRDKILSVQESAISMMPEGLMHGLTPEERRDLFAYLQSEKPVDKSETRNPKSELTPRAQSSTHVDKSLDADPISLSPGERAGVRASVTERIKISPDAKSFETMSGKKFTPLGFNYDRDYKLRLLEEYWDTEWETVVEDFREMKKLGANVVRIHLQFPKFMDAADQPNEKSLAQLKKLLGLAEETGLYLDLTGLGCYRKKDVPAWYDTLDEDGRWSAQANFWSAIARTGAKSPAVFCYDLMNEPVVSDKKEWLFGEIAGFFYVQAITHNSAGRSRPEIFQQWISKLVAAIRPHDKQSLITVGLLPIEHSDFVRAISPELDFISVHLYPHTGKLDSDLQTLKEYSVGKPVLIEETMMIHCTADQLRQFIERSRPFAAGWLGFYWGQTPEELRENKSLGGLLVRDWLKLFQEIQPTVSPTSN